MTGSDPSGQGTRGTVGSTMRQWAPTGEQLALLQLIAGVNKPGMKIATIAVLAPGDIDLNQLMTPALTNAIWTVERGCLGQFLRDPALRGYLRHRVPIIACFEAADDCDRCQAIFGPAAVTNV